MLKDVRSFLEVCHQLGAEAFAVGVEAELSIGVTVGDSVQFIASLDFSSADLRELGALGIALSISTYPTSDEVNDPANR